MDREKIFVHPTSIIDDGAEIGEGRKDSECFIYWRKYQLRNSILQVSEGVSQSRYLMQCIRWAA